MPPPDVISADPPTTRRGLGDYDISRLGAARAPFWWILIVSLACLVVFATLPGRPLILHTLQKLAHPCVFGVIALSALVLQQQRSDGGVGRHYLVALGCAVGLGALTEALQILTHRDPTWRDVLLDTRGALLALAIAACFDRRTRPVPDRRRRALFVSTAAVLLLITLTPLAVTLTAYANRSIRFPVLFAADRWIDLLLVSTAGAPAMRGPLPAAFAHHPGELALHVPLYVRPTGAVSLDEPRANWHGFRELRIEITNPAPVPLELALRIDDRRHLLTDRDRFIRPLTVEPGRATITIDLADIIHGPAERTLDIGDITNVSLTHTGADAGEEFWLNTVTLH